MSLRNAWRAFWDRETVETPQRDKRINHDFTEEDRAHSAEMRRLRQETARMQQRMEIMRQKAELRELKHELADEEDEDEDKEDGDISNLLLQLFTTVKGGSSPAVGVSAQQQPPIQTYQTQLSDADIRDFIVKQDRKHIDLAKKMPKKVVMRQAMQQMGITEQEAERAHQILLNEF